MASTSANDLNDVFTTVMPDHARVIPRVARGRAGSRAWWRRGDVRQSDPGWVGGVATAASMRGVLVGGAGEVDLGLAIRGRQIAHRAASARNLAEGWCRGRSAGTAAVGSRRAGAGQLWGG
jgi:hypothetical protein